ncbi:MAG: ATP-binding protein [Firmicutes bacterium]|nr:ATP-binding protein [Bacillota bacterium]
MSENEKIIEREIYIEQIKDFIDKPFIKIICGLRRSGKSSVLNLIIREVLKISDETHIIRLNFEEIENQWIKTSDQLNEYLLSRVKDDGKYYLFLDEPQEVVGWEKSVNGFRLKNSDIYITGSNSKLLSGEFSTLLGGRYVSFVIHSLSFGEFLKFRSEYGIGSDDASKELLNYITIGGFPVLSTMMFGAAATKRIIEDINSSAILKDVIERKKIRSPELLKKLIAFVYDNVGSPVSINSIVKYLKNEKVACHPSTISEYLGYLAEAYIIHRVQRYDIRGKALLESNEKFYLGEHSLQYALFGIRAAARQGIVENIVYLELLRRGYSVYSGNLKKMFRNAEGNREYKTLEVDFVAKKDNGKIYVQACLEFTNYESTKTREFAPLMEIDDHYPKYVVTLDPMWQADENGVKGIHLKDFLLKDSF